MPQKAPASQPPGSSRRFPPDLAIGLLVLIWGSNFSVVKAALFDRRGRELAVVRRPTPLYSPQPAWSETSMEATGNISRGTAIFCTTPRLRTIERVPDWKVSVK